MKTEHEKYAGWQVSQGLKDPTFWDRHSHAEFKAVKRFLSKPPQRILDLGCGLGRVATYFSKCYSSPPTQYYLADSNGATPTWGWDAPTGFYNDLKLTEEYVQQQGLKQYEIVDLSTNKLETLKDIDLVVSFLAVGFHYPIETYMPILQNIISKHAVLAFGVRRNKYNLHSFSKLFPYSHMTALRTLTTDGKRTHEDVLILTR